MASIFADFHQAQKTGSGQLLASCFALTNTPENPKRLETFSQLANHQTVGADVKYYLLQDRSITVKLTKAEGNAWIEIFTSFWTCVRHIVSIDHNVPDASWAKAFEAYKDVCNQLIRGYSNPGFEAWTVPCLATTGKYLRILAIRADNEAKNREDDSFGNGLSDDIMGNSGKQEKLEQAAWVINRMFTICLSDRHVLEVVVRQVYADFVLQVRPCRIEKVGYIQHYQSIVQNLLQGKSRLSSRKVHDV